MILFFCVVIGLAATVHGDNVVQLGSTIQLRATNATACPIKVTVPASVVKPGCKLRARLDSLQLINTVVVAYWKKGDGNSFSDPKPRYFEVDCEAGEFYLGAKVSYCDRNCSVTLWASVMLIQDGVATADIGTAEEWIFSTVNLQGGALFQAKYLTMADNQVAHFVIEAALALNVFAGTATQAVAEILNSTRLQAVGADMAFSISHARKGAYQLVIQGAASTTASTLRFRLNSMPDKNAPRALAVCPQAQCSAVTLQSCRQCVGNGCNWCGGLQNACVPSTCIVSADRSNDSCITSTTPPATTTVPTTAVSVMGDVCKEEAPLCQPSEIGTLKGCPCKNGLCTGTDAESGQVLGCNRASNRCAPCTPGGLFCACGAGCGQNLICQALQCVPAASFTLPCPPDGVGCPCLTSKCKATLACSSLLSRCVACPRGCQESCARAAVGRNDTCAGKSTSCTDCKALSACSWCGEAQGCRPGKCDDGSNGVTGCSENLAPPSTPPATICTLSQSRQFVSCVGTMCLTSLSAEGSPSYCSCYTRMFDCLRGAGCMVNPNSQADRDKCLAVCPGLATCINPQLPPSPSPPSPCEVQQQRAMCEETLFVSDDFVVLSLAALIGQKTDKTADICARLRRNRECVAAAYPSGCPVPDHVRKFKDKVESYCTTNDNAMLYAEIGCNLCDAVVSAAPPSALHLAATVLMTMAVTIV